MSGAWHGGKGSTIRPGDSAAWDRNFDAIFRRAKPIDCSIEDLHVSDMLSLDPGAINSLLAHLRKYPDRKIVKLPVFRTYDQLAESITRKRGESDKFWEVQYRSSEIDGAKVSRAYNGLLDILHDVLNAEANKV